MSERSRRKAEEAERERLWAAEAARTARQRAIFAALPAGPERLTLELTMLERAWSLLDANECEAADALLEFLPDWKRVKLLEEFFETDHQWNAALYGDRPSAAESAPSATVVQLRPASAETHKDSILAMWAAGKTVVEIAAHHDIKWAAANAVIQRERHSGNPLAARRQWEAPSEQTGGYHG